MAEKKDTTIETDTQRLSENWKLHFMIKMTD